LFNVWICGFPFDVVKPPATFSVALERIHVIYRLTRNTVWL